MELNRYLAYCVVLSAIGASVWWRSWHGNVPPISWIPVLFLVLLVGLNVVARGKGGFADNLCLVIAIALVTALSYPETLQMSGYDVYFEKSNAELLVKYRKVGSDSRLGVRQELLRVLSINSHGLGLMVADH